MGALAGAFLGGGVAGAAGAWWTHRRTRLSAWNLYALAPLGLLAWVLALVTQRLELLPIAGAVAAAGMVSASLARRYRLAALGATGELRDFEGSRVMAWTALRDRRRRSAERTRIATQGELVRERSWPDDEPFVPMSDGDDGRIPCREGRHLLIVGATGSGKTVSARRWLLARIVGDGVGVLVTDPKGDRALARDLHDAARL